MENVVRQANLSPKEGQVLLHGIAGLSDKEIAREMGIALDTVRTYWRRILGKVGGHTRAEVVARIVREWARVRLEASANQNEALLMEIARCGEVKRRFHAMADAAPLGSTHDATPCGHCGRSSPAAPRSRRASFHGTSQYYQLGVAAAGAQLNILGSCRCSPARRASI